MNREIEDGVRPEIESVTIHNSHSQSWRFEDCVIMARTCTGRAELHHRGDKQLWRYLYSGWELSRELKLKVIGSKIIAYLAFEKAAEVSYEPDNVFSVDINEDNMIVAVFVGGVLEGFVGIETGLGRIAIAYSEVRIRKKIAEGRSTSDRTVRKALKRLREEERKEDIAYKVARVIEDLAIRYNARVVVGDVYRDKDKILERVSDNRMRHRVAQWSSSKLARILGQKPVHVETISEEGSSRKDPFDWSELFYTPARSAWLG